MNPFDSETIRLVFIFFVPGFISMKIYDLLVPSERRDFSKDLLEALSYSCVNFAILYWPIVAIHSNEFQTDHLIIYYFLSILILLVAPIFWPILVYKFMKTGFFRRRLVDPILKPWDRLFGQRKAYWVIIHLKDGRKIGGKYAKRSFSSTYPAEEQIYIEEVWEIDQTSGRFIQPLTNSDGLIISKDNFHLIEFFH
ncbi:MAG: hypothetical protein HYZ34_12835 [Ignavibacteriae bacterium]|nr:hypothetical protein [Ignavibacteriota bacterium]